MTDKIVNAISLNHISAGYSGLRALWDVSLNIAEGEFVVVLGVNGAGKSTLLRCVMGLLPIEEGSLYIYGVDVGHMRPDERVQLGLAYMSEFGIFGLLTVENNLRLGGYCEQRSAVKTRLSQIYSMFPELAVKRRTLAASLSGGQRKIVGLGKCLMSAPRLLLLDEPSAGLAPIYVRSVLSALQQIKDKGYTIIAAEQNVQFLTLADRVCVLEAGRVRFYGLPEEIQKNLSLRERLLGI